jgi:hypothetical protein
VALDHETGKPVMGSRIVDLGDGRYQVRAGSEAEAERLMKKMRDRAAAEGKEVRLEKEERSQSQPLIHARVSVHADIWRREAAKIGLSSASLVYPPDWRRSIDAHRLREWMHDRDERTDDGKAPLLVPVPIGQMAWTVLADEHVLFFLRMQDGWTYAVVVLFGATTFAVPVDSAGGPVPQLAWRLDWRHPSRGGQTSSDDLVVDAVRRASEADPGGFS